MKKETRMIYEGEDCCCICVYMWINFGVRTPKCERILNGRYWELTKAFIEPESEHIFEPQDGDKDEEGYVYNSKMEGWEKRIVYSVERDFKRKEFSETTTRNGKHFFTPKTEEIT